MKSIFSSLLIFLISSCGSGGSSSIISSTPYQPPTSSNQFVNCSNYDGATDKIIWIDDFVESTIEAIMKGGRSGEDGEIGDGKIFVLPMDECVRIRTGERGQEAI